MKRPTEVDRRRYIQGVTAAAIVGSVPVAVSATGDHDDSSRGGDRGRDDGGGSEAEIPGGRPFVGDLDGGVLSGDTEFDVENRYEGDPADEDGDDEDGRDFVLHYTTDGEETQDYPATLLNLWKRVDHEITLDALKDGLLQFDFYVGPKHDHYIPGQVYLVIQTPDQKEHDRAWGLYRNVREGGPREEWRTLDVVEGMSGQESDAEGRDPVWRAVEIDVDPEGFRADFETFSDAILQQAIQTRDEEGDTFDDVFDQYDGGSKLLAAGLGSGSSRSATVRDIYYDSFRVGVDDEEWSFDLPAVLQMDAEFDSDGQTTATLSFAEEPEGVGLDAVDEDSVRLYPFSQITPPIGEGAEPDRVDVDDGRIEARFSPERIRNLEGLGDGEQLVVAGQLTYGHDVWFFGGGETTVRGD